MVKSDVLYEEQMNPLPNGHHNPSAGFDAALLYRHWAQQLQRQPATAAALRLPPPLLPLMAGQDDLIDHEDISDMNAAATAQMIHPLLLNPFFM